MPMTDQSPRDHLTSEELAAYLDRKAMPEEKARILAHLDACESCREETADLVRLLHRRDRQKARRLVVPLAAAAAVAGVLLVGPSLHQGTGRPEASFRAPAAASSAEALVRIRVESPASGAIVPPDSVAFAWDAVEEGAVYRLTVTDESGEPLWVHETSTTSLRLPSDVELVPGRKYFWFVDVLLADGSTGSTGVVNFQLGGPAGSGTH